MDKTSLTLGWLVGRQIAGQRRIQEKQPIAYLYNGMQLPPLPESEYPYAMICITDKYTELCLVKSVVGWEIFTAGSLTYPSLRLSEADWQKWRLIDGVWSFYSAYQTDRIALGANGATQPTYQHWTSVDIVSIDTGELLLPASDPIPVYE